MNNGWIAKANEEQSMTCEEDMILKRWTLARFNLLDGIPEDRKKSVACAMENQRLLNERWEENPQFKRVSIPIVRRLMGVMPELTSGRRSAANAYITNLRFMPRTIADKFSMAMRFHNLGGEAEATAKLVDDLAAEIRRAMKTFERTSMVFLGLTLHEDVVCFFYDWE